MNSISGVTMPWRAYQSWVTAWPFAALKGRRTKVGDGSLKLEVVSPLRASDFDVRRAGKKSTDGPLSQSMMDICAKTMLRMRKASANCPNTTAEDQSQTLALATRPPTA